MSETAEVREGYGYGGAISALHDGKYYLLNYRYLSTGQQYAEDIEKMIASFRFPR